MYRLIIFFLPFFCLVHTALGQESDSAKTEISYWPDHILKSRFVYTSIEEDYEFTYWYKNGQKEKEGKVRNGQEFMNNAWDKEGNPVVVNGTGFYTSFHENGVIWQKGLFYEGWKDSLWSEYYDNGRIKSYGSFNYNDSSGNWRTWYDNGQVKEAGSFDEWGGRRIGNWTCYDRNGVKCASQNHAAGANPLPSRTDTGIVSFFYPTGELHYREFHSHLFQDSIKSIAYYKNGKLKEIKFKGQVLTDGYISFYDNGNKAQELDLHYSQTDFVGTGAGTLFWYNGRISEKTTLKRKTCYYPSGKIKCTGNFPPGDNAWIYLRKSQDSSTKSDLLKRSFYLLCPSETIYVHYDTKWRRSLRSVKPEEYIPKIVSWYPSLYETSWYPNGACKHQIEFDTARKGLLLTYFYPDGKICSQGEIRFGSLESAEVTKWLNAPNQTTLKSAEEQLISAYEGYYKSGFWVFYNLDGSIKERIDFEKEPLKKRVFDE